MVDFSYSPPLVSIPIAAVTETNLLEEKPKDIALADNRVGLYFRPFEIKML